MLNSCLSYNAGVIKCFIQMCHSISAPSLPQCDGAGDEDESMELDLDEFDGKSILVMIMI